MRPRDRPYPDRRSMVRLGVPTDNKSKSVQIEMFRRVKCKDRLGTSPKLSAGLLPPIVAPGPNDS